MEKNAFERGHGVGKSGNILFKGNMLLQTLLLKEKLAWKTVFFMVFEGKYGVENVRRGVGALWKPCTGTIARKS